MAFFSLMEKEQRQGVEEYVRYRWGYLETMRSSLEDHAIKFLFGTNAGGAATLLAFIGSTAFIPATSIISLVFFIVGLALTGLGIALGLSRITHLQTNWNADASDMFAGQLEWETMLSNDKARLKSKSFGTLLGWSSFGCWILGTAFGFGSLALFLCRRVAV